MKIHKIKSERQYKSYDWKNYGIQTWGESNDFPQTLDEILTASKTGTLCLNLFKDFVFGTGFLDKEMAKVMVNWDNCTANSVAKALIKDYTQYNLCALHVNYNKLYKIISMYPVQVETVRFGLPCKDSGRVKDICVHPDWGRRSVRRFNPSDVIKYDVFNPDKDVIDMQVATAGGWDSYKGQILVFGDGQINPQTYPLPTYIAAATDMRTEEGLSNVAARNVCSNFMLAGLLVDIMEGGDVNTEQTEKKERELQEFQGDENALQLWYMTARTKEEIPSFIPLSGTNYDKAFTVTQDYIPNNIGTMFKQPAILRAEDVGAGFGADLMINSYKMYNSVTRGTRDDMRALFETVFDLWWVPLENLDCSFGVLVFGDGDSILERLGKDAMSQVIELVAAENISRVQKLNLLKYGFGLSEEEAIKLIPEA